MAPNMKEATQQTDYRSKSDATNFNILKAFVHFSIQVSTDKSRNMGIQDVLKPSSKLIENSNLSVPLIWVPESNDCNFKCDSRKEINLSSKNLISEPNSESNSRTNSTSSYSCLSSNSWKMSKDVGHILDKLSFSKRWRRPSFKKTKSKDEFRHNLTSDKRQEDSPTSKVSDVIDQLTLQQQLALKALNLTVPASTSALCGHRGNFIQVSGHKGCLTPAGVGTIYKKVSDAQTEASVYESLMNDPARIIVPEFHGMLDRDGEKYIEISDLLHGFHNPSVMDIKMGTRTFLESEADNTKPRKDLYERMLKVDPSCLLNVEHQNGSMTKLRYMNIRDLTSTSRRLGYRLEGLKMSDSSSVTELKKLKEKEVLPTLLEFVQHRDSTRNQIVERLRVISDTFQSSYFFKEHEVVGSSLLIVCDENHASAWMIDFAKAVLLPDGIQVNHRDEWVHGNHEEGYLFGVQNLIEAFEKLETCNR